MLDSTLIMLSRTRKDIVGFTDIYIILIRFRPVVDVYRRKVHDNVFGILCFICFDFFLKFSQCSFIVFYLSNCSCSLSFFITHLPLRLLPSRTIIRFFRFGFKSFSGLIISFNHSHLNYRFVVYIVKKRHRPPSVPFSSLCSFHCFFVIFCICEDLVLPRVLFLYFCAFQDVCEDEYIHCK